MLIVNIAAWCMDRKIVQRVSESFHHRRFFFLFSVFVFLNLYEMMDSYRNLCGNHFTIFVNQIIMLCALNLQWCMSITSQYTAGDWLEKNKGWLNQINPKLGLIGNCLCPHCIFGSWAYIKLLLAYFMIIFITSLFHTKVHQPVSFL